MLGFGFWLAEWHLEPAFEWVGFAYLGQLLGVVPPRFSLPSSAVVFITYFSFKLGRNELTAWSPWQWMGALSIVVVWTTLGLFLHRLVVTSSDRARLIQELEAARRELELARQRDVELAALRERERLARDLHDSLGHALVTLTVQLEAAQRLLVVDPSRTVAALEEMKNLTRSSMEDLRRSLANLRAPGLGDRPLVQALRQLCAQVNQRSGCKFTCQVPDAADHFSPAVAEALWRVAQEGVSNVEKHAQARQAQLSLDLLPKEVVLRTVDDGLGLPPDAERKPGHYGLRGLRERIEGLGGVFTLSAKDPHGAILEVRIPLIA
jgi:signal transduction histidine kinase